MKQFTLPKWAVVNGLGNARMIHLGNGEFVSADAQLPQVIESAYPVEEKNPDDITATDAPEYLLSWALSSFKVGVPELAEPEPSAADAANAESNPPAEEPADNPAEETESK